MQIFSNSVIGFDSILRQCPADRVANLSSITSKWRFIRFAGKTVFTGLIIFCLTANTTVANDKFLRVSIDLMEGTTFKDVDCASTNPNALYACGAGGDGAPKRSVGDFGAIPAIEFGFGKTDGAIRYEILIEYRPRYTFEGRANFLAPHRQQSVSAKLSTISGMLAGYVDFTDGVSQAKFGTPFFGFGIGVSHTRIGKTDMKFPTTTTTVPGESHTDLAWMITTGVTTALNERVTLEIAWRYSDLGEIRTGQGMGSVTWRDGSREPLILNLAPTRARLAGHGIRMSLRYTF